MTYGIDIKMPGMLVATVRDAPVRGNKIKSFDAAKVASMAGVKKVVQVGDSGVAVIADTYWHAKKAIDALPVDMGGDREQQGLERHDRGVPQDRPRCRAGRRRQRHGRRACRHQGRGKGLRADLQLSLPQSRHDGADERHRALYERQVRAVGSKPECRSRACGGLGSGRAADRQVRLPQGPSSAAGSAVAAAPTTSPRRSRSPSRCRARRSSSCGRAKRT